MYFVIDVSETNCPFRQVDIDIKLEDDLAVSSFAEKLCQGLNAIMEEEYFRKETCQLYWENVLLAPQCLVKDYGLQDWDLIKLKGG